MLGSLPEVSKGGVGGGSALSLRDIVFTLYRRRWLILAIAVPIIVVGGISLMRQTGSYTAVARIVVELNEVQQPRWNIRTSAIDYDRELSTLFNMAMSVPVIEQAADVLRDSLPVFQELDPEALFLSEERGLEDYLGSHMDVSVVGESSILEFSFQSPHPRISLMFVGALRDAFLDFYTHRRSDGMAIDYYNEQMAMVRSELDSLLVLRTMVLEETGYSSLTDELRYGTGQLANLENELYAAIARVNQLRTEFNNLKTFLDKDPRQFPTGPDESRSQALVYWRNIVSKHEDELNNLLSVHTENSVPVARQKELLNLSLKNLAQHETNYVESLRLQLLKQEERESSLRMLVAEIKERNSRGPVAYQRVSLLDTEITSLRKLLEELQGKRGEVRLSEMADERISNLVNLSDPEVRELISGGRTMIYLVILSFFAVALGLVAAFIMETMDHRVFVPNDIEDNLKLPVFASITKVD